MIESYSFGRMVVDGMTYTSDLVIYPNGTIEDSWWREQGHSLMFSDIAGLIQAEPEVIIVGTGASGLMKPSALLAQELKDRGIELRVKPTSGAVELYNEERGGRRVGACFHLTC